MFNSIIEIQTVLVRSRSNQNVDSKNEITTEPRFIPRSDLKKPKPAAALRAGFENIGFFDLAGKPGVKLSFEHQIDG